MFFNGCGDHAVRENKSASEKNSTDTHDEQFVLKDTSGNMMAGAAYTAKLPSGEIVHGEADDEGKTQRFSADGAKNIIIHLGHKETI